MMPVTTHQPARATCRRSTSHCSAPATVTPAATPMYPVTMMPLDKPSPMATPTYPPAAHPTVLASTHQSHTRQPTGALSPFISDGYSSVAAAGTG